MLTKAQAQRLRGLIARHSRCQWYMGALNFGDGTHAETAKAANKAREALYEEIRKLTEEPTT